MTPSLPFVIKLSVEVRAVLEQRARAYPACHAHRAQVCSTSGAGTGIFSQGRGRAGGL